MKYSFIDMENYPRKAHFDYFNSMPNPYVGLTANVDITPLIRWIRPRNLPFFFSILYCASQAANRVPELRRRIIDGKIAEFDWCNSSCTVMLENGSYCYCQLLGKHTYDDFIPYALERKRLAMENPSLEDGEDHHSLFFISSMPWLSYTALVQPTPVPADSNPRITWGKFFNEGDRVMIPLSLLVNHALVDGSHIAAFYASLDDIIKSTFSGE